MNKFLEKFLSGIRSFFKKDRSPNKNSLENNGNDNIIGNINIENTNIKNNYIGGIVKVSNINNFIIVSSSVEEINRLKYTVLNLVDTKGNTTCKFFVYGEFPQDKVFDIKLSSVDSREEIKGGNYFMKDKNEEKSSKKG